MQLSDKMMMAVIILTLSYVLLFTEKLNRAVVAILGASLMIFAGVLTQESALAAVDFNTLALLIGMMTIVGIGEKSGMFQFVAIWSAQKVKARPRMLLMVLAVVTAVFSAFLVDGASTKPSTAPVNWLSVVDGAISENACFISFSPSTSTINLPSTVAVNPCKLVDSGSRLIFLKTACFDTPISSAICRIVFIPSRTGPQDTRP